MELPVFVFTRDGDLSVEQIESTGLEAIDVSDREYPHAYTVDGERLSVEVEGHRVLGKVVFRRTGDEALPELESRLRRYVDRTGLRVEDTGDFVLDVANAVSSGAWQQRWPKRPAWLARRLRGDAPPRFSRGGPEDR